MSIVLDASVWASAVRGATPILLAAFGCLLCAKAGITNLAIDGFITIGCFISVAVVSLTGGNVWLGMLGGIVGTAVYSLIFGLSVIKFKSNHIIASIAMNLLSTGITEFLMAPVFKAQGLYRLANIKKIPPVSLPFLENVPVLNVLVNNQSIVVLFTIILIFILLYMLRKTKYGLNVIAIGQSAEAAESAGIKSDRVRWSVILLSGAFCGLAGSYLSTIILSEFSVGMVAGRGFTAYTTVVFGAYHPVGVAFASLLFGFADAISIQIELLKPGIATSLVSMVPYILAMVVLTISALSDKLRKTGRLEMKWKQRKQKNQIVH